MRDEARLRSLNIQREALLRRIRDAAETRTGPLTVPPMKLALEALENLIARESAEDDPGNGQLARPATAHLGRVPEHK